jgi:hypothetical protein
VADVDGMVASDYRTGHHNGLVAVATLARIVREGSQYCRGARIVSPATADVFGVRSLTIRHERLIALSPRLT